MKTTNTKTKQKPSQKRKKSSVISNLELIMKEFELAYNLSPGITVAMKKELKKEFLRILGPITKTVLRSRKFSFDLEKLVALQDNTVA
jgi:hypothetical protein